MIQIFTDGGVRGNGKKDAAGNNICTGSFAFVVVDGGTIMHEYADIVFPATNNTMEMSAVIAAMQWCIDNHMTGAIDLYSDSQYVVNGINEWVYKWRKKNWVRYVDGKEEPIKNVQLWQQMYHLREQLDIAIEWVRGHADNVYNNRADELCQLALNNRVKDPL